MKKLLYKKALSLFLTDILVIILTAILFVAFKPASGEETDEDGSSEEKVQLESDKLHIIFFPFDGNASGDSFIIIYNDIEILVDAGTSSETIIEQMEKYISDDNKWDYIIATHADSDHIEAFPDIFDCFLKSTSFYHDDWTLGTIIDFDFTRDKTVPDCESSNPVKVLEDAEGYKDEEGINNRTYYFSAKSGDTEGIKKNTYKNYINEKKKLLLLKNKPNYYPASLCCWQERNLSEKPDGAPENGSVFSLGGDCELRILYNPYYCHRYNSSTKTNSADENILAVCFMITYGEQKFLFTGDLEEYDSSKGNDDTKEITDTSNYDGYDYSTQVKGESLLYYYNKEYLDGGVTFYKAAHHGSRTSNSETFIDIIKPQYVVIPTVAGK